MNDIKAFSDAIIKGARTPGPSSYIPEVAQAMAGTFALGATKTAAGAQGAVASQIADEEEQRRRAAREARMREIGDMLDPSKYQRLRKDDGGFAFYDPAGKEIDIDTFAKRTGQRRTDVLKDSENPLDQQFINDWAALNDVSQAIYSNDAQTIEEYKALFPGLLDGKRPEDIAKLFIQRYPHMFGRGDYKTSYSNLGNPVFKQSGTGAGGGSQSGWSW